MMGATVWADQALLPGISKKILITWRMEIKLLMPSSSKWMTSTLTFSMHIKWQVVQK